MSEPAPFAAIFGCAGPALGAEERAFFAETDPLGFILFKRNCETPDQVRALCAALREAVGRADAPILIDQEGGRAQRLGPPHWRAAPAMAAFGTLARRDPDAGIEAARLNARLIADDLAALGIDVDCAPVLDLPQDDADPIIGDRAFGTDPDLAAALGRAVCDGLMAGGVLPVVKHVPGHGRARQDSHKALPRVDTPLAALEAHDFRPFAALADAPLAMTAHVVYSAVDSDHPATLSPAVVAEVIRGSIGFEGLLVSDDLSMKALSGDFAARARAALAAGCDVVLHCNGDAAEMAAVAAGARPLDAAGMRRLQMARDRLQARADAPLDRSEAEARLAALMAL